MLVNLLVESSFEQRQPMEPRRRLGCLRLGLPIMRYMKFDLRVFLALLAGLVVLGTGYYLLVLIPRQEQARLELQRQQLEREEQAKAKRATFLAQCRDVAEQQYSSYVRLNGTENSDKPGVYSAPQHVWDQAAEKRKAYVDECIRLAEAGIYELPEGFTPAAVGAASTAPVLPDPTAAVLDDTEVEAFVEDYLKAGEAGSAEASLGLYADVVSYYQMGIVAKDAVFEDKRAYFARWPKRSYERVSEIATLASTSSTRRVRFDYTYRVSRAGKTLSGKAYVVLGLEKYGDRILITEENGEIYR